jgi:glycosyltransferase involved in cell wall biosynthesis
MYESATAVSLKPLAAAPGVVVVHNRYLLPGGEDQVFAAETALLERHGHCVVRHAIGNERLQDRGRFALALGAVWSGESYRSLRRLFRESGAKVAHFHNILPQVSPAGYYAARAEGLAVVQTLHNYRLVCPVATMFRDGRVCEDCLGKRVAWPGILHGCYRGSRAATATVATMLAVHGAAGTWGRRVDLYLALTEFAKRKLIDGGLPGERILVKPNFLADDPGAGVGSGGYALYAGRLSPEKGIRVLLEAWEHHRPKLGLRILGDGPMAPEVRAAADRVPGLRWEGWQPREAVERAFRDAAILVMPSLWYEGFPMTAVEAYAAALPLVASDIGSLADIVVDGRTGRLVPPGDAAALARGVDEIAESPALLDRLRAGARAEYLARYTAERNYALLMEAYRAALARAHGTRAAVRGARR